MKSLTAQMYRKLFPLYGVFSAMISGIAGCGGCPPTGPCSTSHQGRCEQTFSVGAITRTCTDHVSKTNGKASSDEAFKDEIAACKDAAGTWTDSTCSDDGQIASCGRRFPKATAGKVLVSIHYYQPATLDDAKSQCALKSGGKFEFLPYSEPRDPYGLP